MTNVSRRQFIASLGLAGAALTATGWYTNRLIAMVQDGSLPTPRGPGMETWVPSLCRLCPAGCGIRVRLVDGLPVGLEGNRSNPISAGGLCPEGFAGLQAMVHPDRIRTPLRRNGPRGSGEWTPITWDEALQQVVGPLERLRAERRPQGFAVLERGDSPLTRFWLERVLRAYGSPNLIVEGTREPWRTAWAYLSGSAEPPVADLPNSDFILSFGHELFETDGHPVWQSKTWGRLRGPDGPPLTTLAYVGPRLSPTAIRADLRVAIRPGTEATLALGLVHILMIEDLLNRTFLERWTRGYFPAQAGEPMVGEDFQSFIRRRYTPEEVSRVTGARVRDIFRLGRAFGGARRPVALVGPGPLAGEQGLPVAMAVVALNLVVGSIARPGGFVSGGSAALDLPESQELDPVARAGLAGPRVDGAGWATLPAVEQSPAGLVANLAARKPYPLEVLLVHGVNPAHEWPDGGAVEKALAEAGLLVVVAQVPDETARLADIILPETSYLEAWQILPSSGGIPFDYAGLQQPAVAPLYQSMSFEDIWFSLARRLGGPAAVGVPSGTYAEWLPSAAKGLFRSGRGTIASGAFQERIAGYMQARGWKVPGQESAEDFWRELQRAGSWVDVPVGQRSPKEVLGADADRFSFWPEALNRDAAKLQGAAPPEDFAYAGPPEALEESNTPPRNGAFPLRLILFDTNTIRAGRAAVTPLMLELSGLREDIGWDSWIDIHPKTAQQSGIQAGDRVRVESATGSLLVRARLTSGVPPDAVAMPMGLGHRHFGRFATGIGVNPMTLVPSSTDPWTGSPILVAQVRVSPGRA
jgi:anaerobic selenocysteine-containing dehydrogenase